MKVRCIDDILFNGAFTKDNIYEVVGKDNNFLFLTNDKGQTNYVDSKYFQKVK